MGSVIATNSKLVHDVKKNITDLGQSQLYISSNLSSNELTKYMLVRVDSGQR